MNNKFYLLIIAIVGISPFCSCSQKQNFQIASLEDPVVTESAKIQSLPISVPGFGIAIGAGAKQVFEVNIEAEDSLQVKEGQAATVYIIPGHLAIPCRVTRVLKNVSTETGQSLAWLKSVQPETNALEAEFVYATMTTSVKNNALTVPQQSLFIRDGKTWVVRKLDGKTQKSDPDRNKDKNKNKDEGAQPNYSVVEVRTGISARGRVELLSGINPEDQVVIQNGLGLLYPNFKASDE